MTRKYKRRFKTTFENGGFWEYYKDLERQYENFLEYVPYLDSNESVISYKLASLLLSIGGYIDSAFKEMVFYGKFSKKTKFTQIKDDVKEARRRTKQNERPKIISIEKFLNVFESEYNLSTAEIIFKRLPEREIIVPFQPQSIERYTPEWWNFYNHVKHDFKDNFKKATLRTTRNALAGAFILNAVHYPSVYRNYEYDVIKKEEKIVRMGFESKPFPLDYIISKYESDQKIPYKLETPLFIFDYNDYSTHEGIF